MRLEGNFTIEDLEFIISTSKDSLKINLTIYKVNKLNYSNRLQIEFEYPELEKEDFLPKLSATNPY